MYFTFPLVRVFVSSGVGSRLVANMATSSSIVIRFGCYSPLFSYLLLLVIRLVIRRVLPAALETRTPHIAATRHQFMLRP